MLMARKTNKYPYLLLLVIHTALLLFVFSKQPKKRGLLALLLSNMGFAFIFDYIVVSFFPGYRYRPKVLKNKYFDNILGATLSQAVYVPFTAVSISGLRLGWGAKLLFSLYFSIIEKLFIHLGLFKRKWWKTRFTFMLIPFFFFISDVRWKGLREGNKTMKALCLYNMMHMTWVNGVFILEVYRLIRFGIGKNYKWQEQMKMVPAYGMVYGAIGTAVALKNKWSLKALLFGVVLIMDKILIKLGLMKVYSMFPLTMVHIVAILSNPSVSW
ncbi:hypothetical protein [Litchfieldia alkalitelluris]|nr:hypothetical protein [Litchfieldia alkalitelluris]